MKSSKRQPGIPGLILVFLVFVGVCMLGIASPVLAATYLNDNADGALVMSGTSPWGADSASSHSTPKSWQDSPGGGVYANSINSTWRSNHNAYNTSTPNTCLTSPSMDLTGAVSPQLTFWQKYDFENTYDYGIVQISKDGGANWTELANYTNTNTTWSQITFDLTPYISNNVKIRFFISTDGSVTRDGWYIDDITVLTPEPNVSSVYPANGSASLPVSASVYAVFDRTMDLATINTSTFIVKDSLNNPVSGTITCDGTKATFTPGSWWQYNSTYTATITTEVKSAAGANMASDYTWSFTSMGVDTVPPTGSITINDVAGYTYSPVANLILSATDDNIGVSEMQFSNDNVTWSPWVQYATNTSWQLTSGEGTKTVYARFRDYAGNTSPVYSDTTTYTAFSLDYFAPYTKVPTQVISGTRDPGWTVSVATDTWASDGAATLDGNTWRYTITDLVAGQNNITITTTNGGSTKTINTSITLVGYFYDYAEDPVSKMTPYGADGDWTLTTSTSSSPSHSYTDSPSGNYSTLTKNYMYTPALSTAPMSNPTLYFKDKRTLSGATCAVYYGTSASPAFTTGTVWSQSGNTAGWTQESASLSSLKSYATIRLKFQLKTTGTAADGWYVDNIFIGEATDSTAPTGSLLINNGDIGTNSTLVTLTPNATDGASSSVSLMQFSNDLSTWSPWEDYKTTKTWFLSSGTGTKTVYVRYKDPAGNISTTYNDTISLDQTAPTITMNAVTSPTTVNSQTISGTANDTNPVTVQVVTDTTASDGMATVTGTAPNYSWSYTIKNLAPGANGITVTATDAGGNVSTPVNSSITLNTTGDVTGPTGTLAINNNNPYTGIANVTLNVTATDAGTGVDKMQFMNNTDGPWTDVSWTVYQATYNWTIGPYTGDGPYTVYARFLDAAGNPSASVSDTIYLDTTAPIITLNAVTTPIALDTQTITGSVYDSSPPTVTVLADTGFSGNATVTLADANLNWYTWSMNVTGMVYGANNFTITAKDAVNNTSTATTSIYSAKNIYWNDSSDVNLMTYDPGWAVESGAWSDSPGGNYTDSNTAGSTTILYSKAINLSTYKNPWLTMKINYALNSGYRSGYGYNGYDAVLIEGSTNGVNWYNLNGSSYYTGSSGGWITTPGLCLNGYLSANFQFRVRFVKNGDGLVGDGVKIDDMQILEREYVKPVVTSYYPANGATGVSVTTPIYGMLNEPCNTTVGGFSVTGTGASGSRSWPNNQKIAWAITHLDYNTIYTATISSVQDLNKNTQSGSVTWTFTTEKDTYPPTSCSVNINSGAVWTKSQLVTLTLSATDPNSGTVSVMRFSNDGVNWSPWEAYVTSRDWSLLPGDGLKTVYVQFKDKYENTSATVSDTINLDMTPPSMTIVPVTSPTNVNSQLVQGLLSDANGATANVYTDTDASDGAATVGGGAWSYTVISLVPGPNVVTSIATDPAGNTATVSGTIYYDNVLPTVTAVSPANNAIGIPVNSSITATFSEPMKASTINTTNFTVKNPSNVPIAGTVSYAGNTATFTPESNLVVDSAYTATVTTGVQDLAGNGLAANYTWSFKTVDTVPPIVSSTNPANGETGVPVDKIISITFSENVVKGENFNSITLKEGATVIECTYSINGSILLIHPNAFLENSLSYTVTIPAGAVNDLVGNATRAVTIFSFTTIAANAPPPPFSRISAGTDHSIAVRGDGALVGWGTNDDGQIGDGQFEDFKTGPVLIRKSDGTPWHTDAAKISAGSTHSMAERVDGSVYGWGHNGFGQLGDGIPVLIGPPNGKLNPVRVKMPGSDWVVSDVYQADFALGDLSSVTATVAGNLELAKTQTRMRSNFSTTAFNNGMFNPTKDMSQQATTSTFVNWTTLANAYRWVDGGSDVFDNWGYFEIAKPDYSVRTIIPLTTPNNADGSYATSTFAHDGVNWQVKYGWAARGIFGLEIKQTSGTIKPFVVRFGGEFGSDGIEQFGSVPKNWTDGSGEQHTLWTWWHNDNLQDDLFKTNPQFTFTVVPFSSNMNQLYAIEPYRVYGTANSDQYRMQTLTLNDGAMLYFQWGNATVDAVQNWIINNDLMKESIYPSSGTRTSPVYNLSTVGTAAGSQINWNATVPGSTGLTIKTNLSLDGGTTWGGWQTATSGMAIPGISNGTDLSNARIQYKADLTSSTNLTTPQLDWVTLSIFTNSPAFTAAAVYAGTGYTFGIKSDGTVWVWGDNQWGQLGSGTQDNNTHANPVQVSGLSGITSIAPGAYHVAALKNDGTVWTWGRNNYGQLGDGTQTSNFTPAQVPGLTGVKAIAAGANHTVALKNDGTVWAWGYNGYGQLGTSPTVNVSVYSPAQVPGIDSISAIDAGLFHTIALRADGAVWAWGRNLEGQVGDGTWTSPHETPAQVSGLNNVVSVDAGGYHNLALKSDGTVWAWGRNARGQLGDRTTTDRNVPVQTYYDTSAPVVASVSPVAGATAIPNNTKISVTFDELIDPLTVTTNTFVVSDTVYGTVYNGTAVVNGNTATFTPSAVLPVNTLLKVIVKPGIKDLTGNPTTTSNMWTFTTGDVAGPMCSVKINFDAVNNTKPAYTNSRYVTLTVSSDDDSGTVAQMQFKNEESEWAEWQPYETTTNWTLSEGDGIKTVYVRFADASGNKSKIYSDTITLHTGLPQLTGSNITNTVYMPLDANITLTFDENIDPGVSYDEINLKTSAGSEIPVDKTVSGNTLTIDPQSNFTYNTSYTIKVPADSVNDNAGNIMAQDWSTSFSVGPDTEPPSVSAAPAGDQFISAVNVVLIANEAGNIYYTTDGSEPTSASTLYTGPFNILNSTTLKYIAVDSAGNQSSIMSEQYIIDPSGASAVGDTTAWDVPVVYGSKVLFAKQGLIMYDIDSELTTTVVDAAYTLKYHDYDPVNGRVAYGYMVSGTMEKGILVYDIGNGTLYWAVKDVDPMNNSSLSGERILYYDVDAKMKIRDLSSGIETPFADGNISYKDMNGSKVAYENGNGVFVRDIIAGNEIQIDPAISVSGLQFSSDPNIVYWTESGQIYVKDLVYNSKIAVDAGANPYVDGRIIYYDKASDTSRHIFAMNLDSGTVTQFTYSTGVETNTFPVCSDNVLVFKRANTVMFRNFNEEPPVITPTQEEGIFLEPITVELKANKPGTEIYYTNDGADPLASPTKNRYSSPINVISNTTLKYYGIDPFGNKSAVASKDYVIGVDVTPPSISAISANGDTIVLNYDEPINVVGILPVDFKVWINGSPTSISSIGVNGATITVTTVNEVVYGDNVLLDYTGGKVKDLKGNDAFPLIGKTVLNNTAPVAVTGVNLNKTSTAITIGSSETLTATVLPDNAYNKSITWSSTNTAVATVNSSGVIAGIGVGTAIITVKTADGGYEASCSVSVNVVPVSGVSLNKLATTIDVGTSETLLATVEPVNATNKTVTWASGDPAVATVSDNGVVIGIAAGTANIVVTTVYGGYSATCVVTVKATAPAPAPGGVSAPAPAPTEVANVIPMTILDPISNKQGADVPVTGAVLQSTDKAVTIDIPSQALANTLQVTVETVPAATIPKSVTIMGGGSIISNIYEFGPPGTTFAQAIKVTLKFDKSTFGSAAEVAPYYLNEQQGVWELIPTYTVDWGNGTVTYETNHFSKYAVMVKKVSFEDIRNHWAKVFIEELAGKGIISGKKAGLFAPEDKVTRAEFARMLIGALGLEPDPSGGMFSDVSSSDWYYPWIQAAHKAGIVKGANGKFRPNDTITREEMAVMLVKALSIEQKVPESSAEALNTFTDNQKVSTWAKASLAKAVGAKIINGRSAAILAPLDYATRAEAAVMIKKLIDLSQ